MINTELALISTTIILLIYLLRIIQKYFSKYIFESYITIGLLFIMLATPIWAVVAYLQIEFYYEIYAYISSFLK